VFFNPHLNIPIHHNTVFSPHPIRHEVNPHTHTQIPGRQCCGKALIKVNWEAEIKEQQELKSTVKLALTKHIWEDGKENYRKIK